MRSRRARSHGSSANGVSRLECGSPPSGLWRVAAGVIAFALILAPRTSSLHAQSATTHRVTGVALDARTGSGVCAEVFVDGVIATRADSLGRFVLQLSSGSSARLRLRAIGYRQLLTIVAPSDADTTHLTLSLEPAMPKLASVETRIRREERRQFDERPVASALSFTRNELAHVPALGDRDVLRVVSLLPGVASRNDMSSSFNVRGGEADQNLVLLDGVPIYNPFHLGGLFGTFIDATVGRVDLLTGGFPAEYGGRLSSVLEVKSAEDARSGVHATTDLSVLSSSVRLSGATGGGRLTWSAAARRTYADKVIEALHGANDFPYHFADTQLHLKATLPKNGTLALTAYSGLDVLDESSGSGSGITSDSTALGTMRNVGFNWGNRVVGVSWEQPLGATTMVRQRVSLSTFHTQFDVPAESLSIAQRMGDTRVTGSVVHEMGRHTISGGYEVSWLRSTYRERLAPTADAPFPDALASDGDTTIAQRGNASALFVDDVWRVNQGLLLRLGLRGERVGGGGWQQLSPRLMARYFVSPDFAISATAGRFSQWTHAVRNEDLPLRLFDLWMVSGRDVPVSTSTHLIVGAERWLSTSRFVRIEAYGKRFSSLTEPSSTIDPRVRPSLLRTFDGTSYGIDAMVRQLERGPLSGWLSYGYALSYRERDDVRYFAAHDRRHNANAVVNLTTRGGWTYGMHAALSSGTPYTGWAGRMSRWQYDPIQHRWMPVSGTNDADIVHGTRNGERLPFYTRLDLSAERRIKTGWGVLYPSASVINVMDRRNVLLYALDQEGKSLRIVRHTQFPILPSLGMRVEF